MKDESNRARGTLPGVGNESREIYNPIQQRQEVVHAYGWYLRKYIADAQLNAGCVVEGLRVLRDCRLKDFLAPDSMPLTFHR